MYAFQIDSTTHCSLKVMPLKTAPTVGTVGRMHIPSTGRDRRASDCLLLAPGSTVRHIPLNTSSNTFRSKEDFPKVVETMVVLELGREYLEFDWFESFNCTHWETLTGLSVMVGVIGARGVTIK